MLVENLELFLADFGIEATIPTGKVTILFDQDYAPLELGAEGRSLVACGRTSQLQNLRHGSTIIINAKTYRIVSVQPTGDGAFTDLILKE